MEKQDFYVYAWYNINTEEIFYIGKGRGKRYKNIAQRNKKFTEYINENDVDVKILLDNLSEEEAFAYEKMLTDEYKKIGQCSCNLAPAGQGGCHFVWTEDMKQYWSKHNPMKREEQRERMKKFNPMYDKTIAKKNGAAHKSPIYIGDKRFDGIVDAANFFNKSKTTIRNWIQKGKSSSGEPCGYLEEPKNCGHGRPVIIDGIYYSSITQGARAIGVAPNNLRIALNKHKTCKSHICEYANQQPSQ